MTRARVLEDLKTRFSDDIIELFDKSPNRVYMEIRPGAVVCVGLYLFRDLGARFNIASGIDMPDCFEILYHFTVEDIDLLISVRVKLPREAPRIQSLGRHIEAVNWIEREMHELLGIEFIDHPDPRRLLLPDSWPEGVYPLRQDYREWDPSAIRDRGV
ncbi:NADH-quinone oxidoreductase subunit C [Candidatus Fermentibacteria bacterium]|nr:NADH-quinone oxidoreductase subunit C [Candidatus Fermentibacteria bacterium]